MGKEAHDVGQSRTIAALIETGAPADVYLSRKWWS